MSSMEAMAKLLEAKRLLTQAVLELDGEVPPGVAEAEGLLAEALGDRPEDFGASRERPENPAHAHETAHEARDRPQDKGLAT